MVMSKKQSNSMRLSDATYLRIRRIAAREQRTLTTVIDRAVQLYEQEARRAKAAEHNEGGAK